MNRFIFGPLIAVLFSIVAYRRRTLDFHGAIAAMIVGTIVVVAGGWLQGILLSAFFLTSSALGMYRQRSSVSQFGGHLPRTWKQVLANSGAGLVAVLANLVYPHPAWRVAFMGSIAAATADTWASELGFLFGGSPWLITSGGKVPAGTPGAVSAAGLTSSAFGALLIGAIDVVWRYYEIDHNTFTVYPIVLALVGGMAGSLVDSLMSALSAKAGEGTVVDHSDSRKRSGERLEGGGMQHKKHNGDVINLIGCVTGAFVAALGYLCLV